MWEWMETYDDICMLNIYSFLYVQQCLQYYCCRVTEPLF